MTLCYLCRILDNLATLSDLLDLSTTNMSSTKDDKLILGFDTYALQFQDINITLFKGQTFSVELGSVEDAMNSEKILNESLKTFEMINENSTANSTATVKVPANSFEMIEECARPRLSYLVFLSDILFQSQNERFDIGSIIVTTRLRCAENASMFIPIRVALRTNEKVCM